MATYNKPGVYIEETLTPNVPSPTVVSQSVAAFIGYADRGPTQTVNNNVVGTPTLVSNWSEFVNLFSYGSNINTFSGIPAATVTGASSSGTTVTLSGSTTEKLKIGSVVTFLSGTGTLQPDTRIVSVTSAVSFVLDKAPSVALDQAALSAVSNSDLKYAVKSFFDNGGAQAYILRDINPNAIKASVDVRDQNAKTTVTGEITLDATTDYTAKKLSISVTAGSPFAGFSTGSVVSFAGIPSGNYAFLNANEWVVDSVTDSDRKLTIIAYPDTAIASTTTATTASVTVTGGGRSTVSSLRVSAKNTGSWGNSVWVGIVPNAVEGYFDLDVYYDISATNSSTITAGDRVERFSNLNMDPASDRYAPSVINSTWIEVTDLNSAATGKRRLPTFTGGWGGATSYNVDTSNDYVFKWNVTSFTQIPRAVRLGVASDPNVAATVALGTDGATPRTAADTVAQFDSLTVPLLINWAGNSKTADVNAALAYSAQRADSFVIIDTANVAVSTVLGTATDTGIGSYATNTNYGAAYYPHIVIADPASSTGKTKSIAPGGAVAAIYNSTDSSRGVFKAPAGSNSVVRTAVSVPSLSNAEFNLVGNNATNLNIIRFVPGSGICVMGARTLNNQFVDRYVPVRRTLNYLGSNLKTVTEFAVFEPNDANLWNRVNGVVSGFLNDFWRRGGLAGATPAQAFYVKCDSTINTPNTISAGELHIEVGVALQKPAEFVIIRIGQLDGGATVTTSV
jgi:phage tail sheath protein FI